MNHQSDWDNEDDLGPEYWEQYMGGPDDSLWETYEKMLDDGNQNDWDYWIDADELSEEEATEHPKPGAAQVLHWLIQSPLPLWISRTNAFRIMDCQLVRLPNGELMRAFDFLNHYGLRDGTVVDNWHIVQSHAMTEDREQLLFFRIAQYNTP